MTYQSPTAVQILTDTRDTLNNPANWIKDIPARNRYGVAVHPRSPYATCWCFSGALVKAGLHGCGRAALDRVRSYLDTALGLYLGYDVDVVTFNDERQTTHADVLEVVNRAIELAYDEEHGS